LKSALKIEANQVNSELSSICGTRTKDRKNLCGRELNYSSLYAAAIDIPPGIDHELVLAACNKSVLSGTIELRLVIAARSRKKA
jgi:hypothetical protein